MRDSNQRYRSAADSPSVLTEHGDDNHPASSKLNWWVRLLAVFLLCATTAVVLPAQTFTTLLLFDGADGAAPYAGLVQGTDGNLYGTTTIGGTHGWGTVFRVTTSGTLSTIYNFCALPNCQDGASPSTLLLGADGNFYGAAGGGLYGGGLIFKMPAGGKPTPIYNFCSQTNCADGSGPQGADSRYRRQLLVVGSFRFTDW